MGKRLPKKVKEQLEKAKESSLLAVDVYNKPQTSFRSGAYIILMIIAWTSLFHEIFEKKKIRFYYRDKKNPRIFERIDGEWKAWELNKCVKEYFKDKNKKYEPIKANLEFFIPLRNKIEHRYLPDLDNFIFGECQSLLNNFEFILTEEFGEDNIINENLVYSLQFAKASPKIKNNPSKDFKLIKDHIMEFRNNLSDEIFVMPEYSFKIALIQTNNPNRADCAIEFVKYDESKPEEMAQLNHMIQVVREKITPVSNFGLFKAGDVAKTVQKELSDYYGIKIIFSTFHHNKCCLEYDAHPSKSSENKRSTNTDFCTYDDVFDNYVFTPKWTEYLIKKLKDKNEFLRVFPLRKREVLGLLTSTQVTKKVKKSLNTVYGSKIKFSHKQNKKSAKEYSILHSIGKPKSDTNEKYCVYNGNDNYLYTPEWVNFLIDKFEDKNEFLRLFPNQKDMIESR